MSVIRILPEAVANKIAAGEVVERPGSVVKELLENSLDAGAERLEVQVEAGGKRLIRVVDNGCGMTHDDALLAFERHATSKIRSAEDLFEVSTLGFRGEALPSVAAVSRLVLETRHASESAGSRLEIAGGRLRDVKEVARAEGTEVEVRDIFFNTPARRKFLKSESTELGHIATLVTHYALAHPEKSFRLTSVSSEILNVSPVADLRARLYQVMGGQLLEQLVEVPPVERAIPASPAYAPEENEEEAPPSIVRLSGFVSRPEVERLNRNHIYFFVNRRLVRDRLILHAITEAYRNILPARVFPVALVFLELRATEVDVNVHPSKTEVRFRHSGFIHDFARDSIRQALIVARPVAAFPFTQARRTDAMDHSDAEVAEKLAEESLPSGTVSSGHELGEDFGAGESRFGPSVARMRKAVLGSDRPSLATGAQDEFELSPPQPDPWPGVLPLGEEKPGISPAGPGASGLRLKGDPYSARWEASVSECAAFPKVPSVAKTPEGAPESARISHGESPNDLRPLGQIEQSFIVATNDEGLWIVDQHVAHERILFERYLEMRRERKVEAQRLLLPEVVELKPDQQVTFQAIADELLVSGFEVELFGQRTVAIKTAPAGIAADDVQKLLVEILDGVGRESRSISLDALRAKIGASVACHAAVKANMALDRNKMEWLLRELSKTECPMTCPHGRPIMLRYSLREIQKAFKRL